MDASGEGEARERASVHFSSRSRNLGPSPVLLASISSSQAIHASYGPYYCNPRLLRTLPATISPLHVTPLLFPRCVPFKIALVPTSPVSRSHAGRLTHITGDVWESLA
jgi:hypothetical protein